MSIDVHISTNAAQLAKKFDKDIEQIKRFLGNAVRKATFLVERGAKIKVPVDTGRLRSSIETTVRPLEGTVRTNVEYAHFVHDGTRNMRARPFMRDAADEAGREIEQIFIKAVHDAIQ
jgi:HK97 gp10 family phage protein